MNGHTPGPWEWMIEGKAAYLMPEGKTDWHASAIIDDGSAHGEYPRTVDPESANARLIAAAPELLKALGKVTDALAHRIGTNADEWVDVIAARAAIAKATGTPAP